MNVVLMYHALFQDDASATVDAEDLPYAVRTDDFARQLDLIVERPAHEGSAVHITFDDGHASNHELALPMLLERGLSATFFITTGFTGTRPHFCSQAQLLDLQSAGMTIGGHGHTHAFLDDLDVEAARSEFDRCQAQLSQALGGPVDSLSFPGGRHDATARRLARQAGFTHLYDSRLALAPAQGEPGAALPRVAIRSGTTIATFERMIRPDPGWYRAQARRQSAKHLVRRMLGNRLYHGLYRTLSAR